MGTIGFNFVRGEPFISQKRGTKTFVIKDNFKTVKDTHFFPARRGLIIIGKDSFKPVVVDEMVLRSDVPRSKIANQTNCLGMTRDSR